METTDIATDVVTPVEPPSTGNLILVVAAVTATYFGIKSIITLAAKHADRKLEQRSTTAKK